MGRIVAGVFGAFVGALGGLFACFLLGGAHAPRVEAALVGVLVGGVAGAVAGKMGGEMGGHTQDGNALVGALTGAIAGILSAYYCEATVATLSQWFKA